MHQRMTVRINGTDKNPFHAMGLTQNPFPQVARAEYMGAMMAINKLGAEPIQSVEQIRRILGSTCSDELITLCCDNFVPGTMIEFDIFWKL